MNPQKPVTTPTYDRIKLIVKMINNNIFLYIQICVDVNYGVVYYKK